MGSLGGLIFVLVHPTKIFVIAGISMAVLSISMGLTNAITNRRAPYRRLAAARARYAKQLEEISDRQRAYVDSCVAAAGESLCSPQQLLHRALDDATRWDRRPDDADFGWVRLGDRAPEMLFAPDVSSTSASLSHRNVDPFAEQARMDLFSRMAVSGMPAVVDLVRESLVVIGGPRAVNQAASLIAHLAVTHSPADLLISFDGAAHHIFGWAKWLPHVVRQHDGGRHLMVDVVMADQLPKAVPKSAGKVTICVSPRLPASASSPAFVAAVSVIEIGPRHAESVARALAPFDVGNSGQGADVDSIFQRMIDGLATSSQAVDQPMGRLQALLGSTLGGDPVVLDINEAAFGGVGPHGLCIGATGSGKSELLRTMVTSLALNHDPSELNFVLVDFKGGAAFADLAHLAHVAGVITNLANDSPLIERVRLSILGELDRRQELLASAGNMPSLVAYNQAAADGQLRDSQPLPSLLILIDEFGELLVAQPDFVDVFTTIGRIGRSLGVHLLLASQRLEEGRLRGLESHLSYRICLRTFSTGESRAVIGGPMAADLPNIPGHAYLAAAGEAPQRFIAAYVSGPSAARSDVTAPVGVTRFDPWTNTDTDRHTANFGPSLVQQMLTGQQGKWPRARQIWAPVLPPEIALHDIIAAPTPANSETARRLVASIGVGDLPTQQRQISVSIDVDHSNAIVVGGARRGVSTALATSVLSLANSHSPSELNFHLIDMAGSLQPLADLTHVGTLTGRRDPETVGRVLAWCAALIEHREASFTELAIDVVLVLDGWQQFRAEWPNAESLVTALAQRGPRVGLHLLVGASRWIDIKSPLRDTFGTKIELGLADPTESIHSRRLASSIGSLPGRGLFHDGTLIHVAKAENAPAMVSAINEQWATHSSAAAVPILPRVLSKTVLPDQSPSSILGLYEAVIGVRERDLALATISFDRQNSHLLILGDAGCGLTNTLRILARQLAIPNPSAMFALVDYRRGLVDCVPANQVAMIATNEHAALTLVNDICAEVERRLPPASVTPHELSSRSWWQGPELFVLIDDEDLVAGGMSPPLVRLADVAVHGGDVGLHLIVGRRVAGMSRAAFAPLMNRMGALGTQAFVMSGDPQEGVIAHGERAMTLPIGRGRLLRRRQTTEVIQVAYDERIVER